MASWTEIFLISHIRLSLITLLNANNEDLLLYPHSLYMALIQHQAMNRVHDSWRINNGDICSQVFGRCSGQMLEQNVIGPICIHNWPMQVQG